MWVWAWYENWTLEVYFYNINECSWQLFGEWNWNKTFLPVSINSSGKRPENTRNNSSLRQKKTTTALEGILSGIDLVKKKGWRNKNDELEAFRLKEHIVASRTITGVLPGQGLVLCSLLRSLGSTHGNLLTFPHPPLWRERLRGDPKLGLRNREKHSYIMLYTLSPLSHQYHSLNSLGQFFPKFMPRQKKVFTEIIESEYLWHTKCRKCMHLIKL